MTGCVSGMKSIVKHGYTPSILHFTEARIHGVGYYSFSTDEKERRKQMEKLIKSRQETLQAQKQTEEVRKKRDEAIAARVKAARARQRARAGLPPEEPEGMIIYALYDN